MHKFRRQREAGFTLIELLIVILIVGILAAVAAPLYFGYVKDAKTAEGKALLGSLWTALQGCSQALPGNTTACTTAAQFGKIGLDTTGLSPDGRWKVTGGTANMTTGGVYGLSGVLNANGQINDVVNININFNYNNGSNPPGSFQCDTGGGAGPC